MKTLTETVIFLILFTYFALDIYSQSAWVQQNSGVTNNVAFVEAVDANNAFVGNPVHKTTNGGETWFSVTAPSISRMQMINGTYGYAAVDNNYIHKTTNAGLVWSALQYPTPPTSHISFINENTGIVGGEQDMDHLFLYRTYNGGVDYTVSEIEYRPEWPQFNMEFYDVKKLNINTIYIAYWVYPQFPPFNLEEYVKKSTDDGSTFSTVSYFGIYEMDFPSATIGFARNDSTIYKSVNDNWVTSLYTTSNIHGMDFPSVNIGYAVCNGGVMYKTANGGSNWYTLNLGTTKNLMAVRFINELTGWVVGDSGLILKTTTGGETPVIHSVSGTVKYQDNNQPVTSGYVKAIRYDSATYNIITVDSAQIQSNGAYTLPNCPPITLDIMAYENDEEELYFVPTYYVSTIYWENAAHVKPDSNLTNINIAVKRTENPGGSMYISGYVYSNELDNTALRNAVIYSRTAGLFRGHSISVSNGYYKIDSLPAGVYELIADRMGFSGDSYIISLTNSGLDNVNFYLDNVLVPVSQEGANVPDKYWLAQNYPNPFNPVTEIRFGMPNETFVQLLIYDLLGREVAELVNKNLKAGEYKVRWNAANYSSGIYFYKLQTNHFTETRKLVLMK
jgi:hypothetical protein